MLFADSLVEISELKSENIKNRLLQDRYVISWWLAIVSPDKYWDTASAPDIIEPSELDMLATAADMVVERLGGQAVASTAPDLVAFHQDLENWAQFVAISDEITDEAFRGVLQAQIEHLMWLIENAATFGLPRIVQRGDELAGTLIRATARQGAVKNTQSIRDRITNFITVLTLVANLIHSSQVIYDSTDHALPGAEKFIKELTSGNPGSESNGGGHPHSGDRLPGQR